MLVGVGRLIRYYFLFGSTVVPMLVGVGRDQGGPFGGSLSVVPMLVGVGRLQIAPSLNPCPLSPCSWGWAGNCRQRVDRPNVVPMLVGVGRTKFINFKRLHQLSPCSWGWAVFLVIIGVFLIRCPHARGGGPALAKGKLDKSKLSPCSWGWADRLGERVRHGWALSPCSWGWAVQRKRQR